MPSTIDPKQARRAAEAKLKAAKQAEKERRKNSTDPADMGPIRQIRTAYNITKEHDKPLPWLLLGSFLVPLLICLLIAFLTKQWIFLPIMGVLLGIIAAMIMLVQRTKRATFTRYAGQAGSAEVALSMLPKTWTSTPAVAATKQLDVVHRTLGPGGLILVGEGEPGRLKQLLESEAKKHQRLTERVEVTTVQMGEKEGQIPLSKLTKHLQKMPKKLEPYEITEIKARLRALDAVRPKMPIPRGPMPTSARQAKGSRQALRGR